MTVRLYAGNLPADVDRDALAAFLTAVAEILSVKVVRDRKSNRCKGYGFVTVATPEIAETLIAKLNGAEFAGQALKLEIAQPKEKEAPDSAPAPEATSDNTSETSERPRLNTSKKQRSKSQDQPEANTPAVEPDPRWATQLQRIKEQLLAAGKL